MFVAQESIAVHRLLDRLSDARRRSDEVFSVVRADSLYERPIPERHRIIFYVGHLEAFDWNLLLKYAFGTKSFDLDLNQLFAFGIDPIGGGLPSDQPSDWPSAEVVQGYVSRVRRATDKEFSDKNLEAGDTLHDGFPLETLLNVAIEHRLMHVETLAYMLHQLPLERKTREQSSQLGQSCLEAERVQHRMVEIPSGVATLGLSRASGRFGWDNEYETHTVHVPAFAIDQYKVTNGRYLDFVDAGGYGAREFWSEGDWNWKVTQGISHPVFWRNTNKGWCYRTMFEEIALPLDWPVYVSHAEATAYAKWAGKVLPTEEEWQRVAYGTSEGTQRYYPWGDNAPGADLGNFDFHRWDPLPVDAFPLGKTAFGVYDMAGNGWEWTSTVFAPFEGFKPFSFYAGYSADFFDGKHFVMKGGSARTATCMLRPTFRNWFQAHYQYVYAGFRCVSR
jgi:gamma-glutamyl hercynylcysteine S-oxide synthase